jgi:hypothetical protein
MAKGNQLKQNTLKSDDSHSNEAVKTGRLFNNVMGGGFLSNEKSFRMLPFLLFVTFLGVIYIANIYYAEKSMRVMDDLKTGLKELRYEYISTHTKLTHISKQSELAKRLKPLKIKESTKPPFKIKDKKQQ